MTERGGRRTRPSPHLRPTVLALSCALASAACRRDDAPPTASSATLWEDVSAAPLSRPGMVYVPAGTLRMGTPRDAVPRMPDVELAGEPVEVGAFLMDLYLHPNEAGAMPTTNVTQPDAERLCEDAGKRLCTEVELERACKGDSDHAYATGARHADAPCGLGRKGDSIVPNGFHGACVSSFGVHDLHGSAWSWTSSDYGRGTTGLVSIKGGNGIHGDVVGRCANTASEKPTNKSGRIGFRCCSGARNDRRVELEVTRGAPLRYKLGDEARQRRFEVAVRALPEIHEGRLPPEGEAATKKPGPEPGGFVVERVWVWHPLGNEELWFGGGCSPPEGEGKRCGAFVGRLDEGEGPAKLLFFVSSDRWQPVLAESDDARFIHVQGGDPVGAFRARVSWDWGRVALGPRERKRGKNRWVVE